MNNGQRTPDILWGTNRSRESQSLQQGITGITISVAEFYFITKYEGTWLFHILRSIGLTMLILSSTKV